MIRELGQHDETFRRSMRGNRACGAVCGFDGGRAAGVAARQVRRVDAGTSPRAGEAFGVGGHHIG